MYVVLIISNILRQKIIMKDVKTIFETRTSIRRYEREPISEDAMNLIYSAILNTQTSYNGQQFTVIDITDQEIKEELYSITNQKQIKTCNHFMVFCADYKKIGILTKHKDLNETKFKETLDGIMVGVIDAALAMGNAVVAAEASGLGCCCIGYARTANPTKIAELLKLPEGVFVVCGLAIGVPREFPDLKPKLPKEVVIHNNSYNDNLLEELINYDNTVTQYNKTRSGATSDNDWCGHILDYYKLAESYNMLDYIRQQGLDVKK